MTHPPTADRIHTTRCPRCDHLAPTDAPHYCTDDVPETLADVAADAIFSDALAGTASD